MTPAYSSEMTPGFRYDLTPGGELNIKHTLKKYTFNGEKNYSFIFNFKKLNYIFLLAFEFFNSKAIVLLRFSFHS